jgi:hypothetical protein
MKKLIAGFVLAWMAAPAAQAWTGGVEDMRTMEANESGPVVRVKGHPGMPLPCGCGGQHRRAGGQVRHVQLCPTRTRCGMPGAHQVVLRTVAPRPASNHIAQRVVSEKIYVQKVNHYPATVCPTAR